MKTSSYRIIVWACAFLVAAYLCASYFATTTESGPEGQLYPLTGEPKIVAPYDSLDIVFKSEMTDLTLTFELPIAGQIFVNGDYSTPDYNVGWDGKNRSSVSIKAARQDDAGRKIGFRSVRLPSGRFFPTVREYRKALATVTVGEQTFTPYAFLSTVVVREDSNLELYYPLGPQNISSEIARRVGPSLVDAILYSLLFLAGSQILLLLATIKQPEVVSRYFKNFQDAKAVSIIDMASNDFAIALGLLGTISAIWVALEQPGMDFSSFDRILDVLRKAVFTTVLGIATKMLCSLRSLPRIAE
jgi:hypothetical protein